MAFNFFLCSPTFRQRTKRGNIFKRLNIVAGSMTDDYSKSTISIDKIVQMVENAGLKGGNTQVGLDIRVLKTTWRLLKSPEGAQAAFGREMETLPKDLRKRVAVAIECFTKDGIDSWEEIETKKITLENGFSLDALSAELSHQGESGTLHNTNPYPHIKDLEDTTKRLNALVEDIAALLKEEMELLAKENISLRTELAEKERRELSYLQEIDLLSQIIASFNKSVSFAEEKINIKKMC